MTGARTTVLITGATDGSAGRWRTGSPMTGTT